MAFAALLFASCVKELDNALQFPPVGDETMVRLDFSVAGMIAGDELTLAAHADPATRSIPPDMGPGQPYDDNYPTIQNVWIIQFDGNTPSARMLGAPRFLSVADGDLDLTDPQNPGTPPNYPLNISVPLVQVSSACYTLFVANIRQGNLYNWNLTSESTFADVITRVKAITDENGVFEDFLPGKTLLMSAVTESPVQLGTTLYPVFTRNVAKVTLNLTLSNPNMTITSVRLRNVANNITFADAALANNGVSATTLFPIDGSPIDYAAITDAGVMPTNGMTETFSWYVPRNQQGVNARSGSVREKTFYAPMNATYIEIVATSTSPASTSVFRVYPGADMIGDFNLTTNHEYTVGLNVVDIGTDPADSRVQTFGNVDYSGPGTPGSVSNSFILNPAPAAGGVARTYRIPIDQVNRFWSGTAAGYGNNPLNVIGASDNWVVDLIWTDLPALFSSTPSTTAITLMNNNSSGAGTGTGPNQTFMLNVPANLPAGNFTLGLKKVGGDGRYLWSWHFWVTDYQPDKFNFSTIDPNVYTYIVPGGQVERYGSPASGTDLWSGTGMNANKVMMDRNLGAVETFFTTAVYSVPRRGILYYQFGRKDPLPAEFTYAPNASVNAIGPVSIAESVSYPWAFYTVPTGNWTTDANATTHIWNDPNVINNQAGEGKSIYDPCPPGWKLPANGTWNDFNRQFEGQFVTVLNPLRDLGWNFGRGIGSVNVPVNGLRYWPGTTLTDPAQGKIWFPATGYRSVSSGALSSVGSGGYNWSATPSSATSGFGLNFFSTSVNPSSSSNRGYGFPVRCLSE